MIRQRGSLATSLARGSAVAFIIYLAGALVTFLSQLVLARLVGAAGYGIYAYVLAWITILAYVAALGFEVSLLRIVAAYRVRGEWGLVRGILRYAEWRCLMAGVSIAGLGVMTTLLAGGDVSPELKWTFLYGLPIVPLWALLWLRGSSLRAFGGVALALAPDRLVRDGTLLLALGVAAVLSLKVDAPVAMLATLIGTGMGLATVSIALRCRQPREVAQSTHAYRAAEWRRVVIPLLALALSEVALNRTGVLVLGWVDTTKQAGIFALAFNLTSIVALPRIAVNATFAPTISSLYTRGEISALQGLITRTSLWSLSGAAATALFIAFTAAPFLSWFGRDFEKAVPLVWILLVGQLAVAAGGGQQFLMTMTGNERDAAVVLVSCTLLNAVLTRILVGSLGAVGAAMALAVSLVCWQIAMAVHVYRRLGLLAGILASFRRCFPGKADLAVPQQPNS